MPCQCANLDERWLCRDCGASWFGTLTRSGCPNCGAGVDRIDMRNDLTPAACPSCKGSGWIWSTETPGLRNRCDECGGSGEIHSLK